MQKKLYEKIFKEYYLVCILIYFVIFNIINTDLIVKGILYYLFLIKLIIATIAIIIKYNNTLKYKEVLYPFFLINIIFSKNIFYAILLIITFILITILNFEIMDSIKKYSIIFSIISVITIPIIAFVVILSSIFNINNIYENTHYYCDNYEIYMHSAGAMDSYHYTVIKRYEFIKLNNIIEIVYNKYVGNEREDYENILNNKECILVSEE